jgi:hypothetical protein
MYLIYTPKRKITGTPGVIQHNLSKFDYQPKENSKEQASISGVTEGILQSIDDIYSVKTQPIPAADMDKWREWFASTAAAEVFLLDADDTASSVNSVAPMSCIRVSKSYKESREGIYYLVSFKIKRVY